MFEFPPPENHLNPKHFNKGSLIEYIVGQLRKAKNLTPPGYDISDKELQGIVYACYGIRCWLESEKGSIWLYGLTGVEELQPHVGYNYWLVTPQENSTPVRMPLTPISGVASLVIYTINPVDRSGNVPKEAIIAVRDELYKQGVPMPDMPQPTFIDFVLRHARDWFSNSAGYQWCAAQTGYPTRLKVFAALSVYGQRAFKITKQGADSFWAGPRVEGISQMQWIEHAAKAVRVCEMCDQEFPCIQTTRRENLCCHCLSQTSKEATDVLDLCAYEECKVHGPCKNYTPLIQVRSLQKKWRESLDIGMTR
jgi:hypothetical protein